MNEIAPRGHIGRILAYTMPVGCVVALAIVINTTNPTQSNPLIILCVFLLIYTSVYGALAGLYTFVLSALRTFCPQTKPYVRRGYYVLSIVALVPVLLAALNTLGRLDAIEVLLVLVLAILGCFYIDRRLGK